MKKWFIATVAATTATLALGIAAGTGAPREVAAAGPQQDRSQEATRVEAKIAEANLAEALKAATGDQFAGVWFEPETALVHVGVTSAASRSAVESVARKAGLAANVVEDPVAFTWAQLDAAQGRWDRRLTELYARNEAATWLDPKRNAVAVELGLLVPAEKGAALEREAAADDVRIEIGVAKSSSLRLERDARCNKFVSKKAYCDPTIVAGVTIDDEGPELRCTAGPAVIHKDRTKPAVATETFILTAGHCLDETGGKGKKWSTYNKAATRSEIGQSGDFLFGETDVGLIKVNTGNWAKANDPIPVVPTIAPWDAEAPEPFPVTASEEPMVGTKACLSGQASGTSCGEVVKLNQTLAGPPVTKNLVEVKGATAGSGDSGAPWFLEVPYREVNGKFEPTPTGHVLGTHVGRLGENPLFHSLATSFAALKAEKGLELELLTEDNKVRHPKIRAKKYPATIQGVGIAQELVTEAGTIECKAFFHLGSLAQPARALTVTPTYTECTAFGFLEATMTMEGCSYAFYPTEKVETGSYAATVDILCPAGKSIKVIALTCKAEVKEQKERASVAMVNDSGGSSTITVKPNVTGIAYTVTQDGFLCPFSGTGAKTGGAYKSSSAIAMSGKNPSSEEAIGIEVTDN